MEVIRRVRHYQVPLHRYMLSGGKRAICIAHRRWGKDEMALQLTSELLHRRVGNYWHCLPEFAQARRAIWSSVNPHTGKRRIDEAFPIELRESTNEQEMMIRFKNGSSWQLIGSDQYDRLVGASVAGVVFSEWALANPSAWAYISPMLVENDGWAIFITTPRGRNHAKSMYDRAVKDPTWFAQVSTIEDTRALTPEQCERQLEEYKSMYGEDVGRATFEQEYLCSFNATTMGAFYAAECLKVRSSGRMTDKLEPEPGYPVHRAWDLGVSDSTAIWWFQVVGTEVRVLDYYEANGVGVDHYAEVIQAKPYADGTDYVPHDARIKEWGSGRTRVQIMLDLGLHPQVVPRTTDADGHQAIRSTLPHCIFHTRTDERGFHALESYKREWDDNTKDFKQSAKHDWSSHGSKAFQYLAQAWRAERPQAPKEKDQPEGDPNEVTLNQLWDDAKVKRRDRV